MTLYKDTLQQQVNVYGVDTLFRILKVNAATHLLDPAESSLRHIMRHRGNCASSDCVGKRILSVTTVLAIGEQS